LVVLKIALWVGITWVGFSLPWACATDIASSESEAEVITAMAALRMFNIFHSPLDVIVAPGRDRAAMSIFSGF
jgi:hypothetical protein